MSDIEELAKRIAELEAELEVTERLYQERDRLLRSIPPCDQHGSGCVPAAIEWVEAQQRARVPDVDALAAFIRKVDGSHRMGAGVLAERICDWWVSDAVAVSPAPKAQEREQNQNALIRGAAQEAEPRVKHTCNMGVGCEEYGICYAMAHGEPDRCGREQAPQPAEVVADDAYSLAHEIWATAQLGPHDSIADAVDRIAALLARAQLTAAGGREDVDWPQQVFELCNFLAGHGWTMTKATHEAWMLSTGDANKYPNPLDALARMALAATQPAKESDQ